MPSPFAGSTRAMARPIATGLQMRGINEAVNSAVIDNVELVNGLTQMLYGRVEPGRFVNVVTR